MIIFLVSMIKELLGTINGKLYIAHKDKIAAFTCGIAGFVGELKSAIVLGIPITYSLLIKALLSALAIFVASLLAIPIFKLFPFENNKKREYIVKFKDATTCEFVNMQLKEKGIHTHYKQSNKKLIVDSNNKKESLIIMDIVEDYYTSIKINDLKDIIINPKNKSK